MYVCETLCTENLFTKGLFKYVINHNDNYFEEANTEI